MPLASLSAGKDAVASTPVSMTGSLLLDLTSLPLSSSVGPRAPTHLGVAFRGVVDFHRPPEPSDAIDCVGEFRPSVARLPHYELGLSIMSSECTVGWESLQCTPCEGLATGEPPPAVPQHVL
jgi:hypothetical protein